MYFLNFAFFSFEEEGEGKTSPRPLTSRESCSYNYFLYPVCDWLHINITVVKGRSFYFNGSQLCFLVGNLNDRFSSGWVGNALSPVCRLRDAVPRVLIFVEGMEADPEEHSTEECEDGDHAVVPD